jgi:hypothetical protein
MIIIKLVFILATSNFARADCKLFYASQKQIEDLKYSNQEIKNLSAGLNKVLKASYNVLSKIDRASLGLISAVATNGKVSFEDIKPTEWEKMNLVGRVIYQESDLVTVPIRGAKVTFSEGETSRTITTGTDGEFAEYFYKIVPYTRLRLFPAPIIEIGKESKKTINVPIDVKLESKTCSARTRILEVPLDSFVLVATTKE